MGCRVQESPRRKRHKGARGGTETPSVPNSGTQWLVISLSLFHADAPKAWTEDGPPGGRTPCPSLGSAPAGGHTNPSRAPYLVEPATIQRRDPRCLPAHISEPTGRCRLETKRGNMERSTGSGGQVPPGPTSLSTAGDWIEEGLVQTMTLAMRSYPSEEALLGIPSPRTAPP